MPRMMKDENGDEFEVFTKEELDAAKKEALKPIIDKLGINEENIEEGLDNVNKKINEHKDWSIVKEGKEKTKTKAQEEMITKLKEKGFDVKINNEGGVEVDGQLQTQQTGMTPEQAQAMMNDAILADKFNASKETLLSKLDSEKRVDVQKQMDALRAAGIQGDVNQLFNMSLAATGVDAPSNMGNPMNGHTSGAQDIQKSMGIGQKANFADTPEGRTIMRNMGMSDEQIARADELKGTPNMVTEGRLSNEGGRVANMYDLPK